MTENPDPAILDTVLGAYPLHARITDDARYCGRWRDAEPQHDRAWVHLMDEGRCRIEAPSLAQPLNLGDGDLVMFPHGHAHTLRSDPDAAPDSVVTMICGEFQFAGGARNPLVDALPTCLVVRATECGDTLRRLAHLLIEQTRRPGPGQRAVVDKLADALFAMAVRQHLEDHPPPRGLLVGLADPRLRPALEALHREPGRDWSLPALADLALLSRAAFAQRFTDTIGQSPMQYLTQWRMNEALRLLRDPRQSVASIAEQLGYESEAGFRRTFKRVHGIGPGHYRATEG
ncbi:MAG TPA: AraC family transcriptional regulator [Solimonas sp.]